MNVIKANKTTAYNLLDCLLDGHDKHELQCFGHESKCSLDMPDIVFLFESYKIAWFTTLLRSIIKYIGFLLMIAVGYKVFRGSL